MVFRLFYKILLSLLWLILNINFISAQNLTLHKVFGTNLFELSNGQFVKMAFVSIPSTELKEEILDWEKQKFEGRQISLLPKSMIGDTIIAIIQLEGNNFDKDIAIMYLNKGYAVLEGNANNEKYTEYIANLNFAKSNKLGIWALSPYDKKESQIIPHRFYKDPTLAGVLSFVTIGGGQFYNEEFFKGVLFIAGGVTCYYNYVLSLNSNNNEIAWLLIGASIHLWSIIEAVDGSHTYNNSFTINKINDHYVASLRIRI